MKYSIYAFLTLLAFLGLSLMNVNEYIFFAGFVILQFVVLVM